MSTPLILVPLDGSARALHALPVAASFRQLLAADLLLLHVSIFPPPPLGELVERLGVNTLGSEAWSITARSGDPSTAILDEAVARSVELIVLCTHTGDSRPDASLGRTAQGVLRGAACPIVFVPPGMPGDAWRPRRVLLPYDGSLAANAAAVVAARLARESDVELLVIQVGDCPLPGPLGCGGTIMPRYVDQAQHEWATWRDELLARLASFGCNDMRTRLCVLAGDPPLEILKLAEDPESLIVMSWNGEWSGERARTLKGILGTARCPVLIVPSGWTR